MNLDDSFDVELAVLIGLFYTDGDEFGKFELRSASELPQLSRDLLAHDQHMTVAVERCHGGPVEVEVLETRHVGDYYSRKILLRRPSDRHVVMAGIVRMNLAVMSEAVRAEILSQQIPLGRILIDHDVLRTVKLLDLFEIRAGHELVQTMGLGSPLCYGRTALIFCDGRPAIELLEIVP